MGAYFMNACIFTLLFLIVHLTGVLAKNDVKPGCEAQVASCFYREAEAGKRAVCGTDNETYTSRCQLLRAQCQGNALAIKHKGPCHESHLTCFGSRNYAMRLSRSSQVGAVFIPKCRRDGSYAPVQCHKDTGCWCVTGVGKHVPNTSVRNGRPKCAPRGKSTRRRSSNRGNRRRRGCSHGDKVMFNKNLIAIFASEYERSNAVAKQANADKDQLVLTWKFSNMDADSSQILEKPEYRELRRLVKKVVKPKRCAKMFARVCDMNHDEQITRQEWNSCLTDNGLNYRGSEGSRGGAPPPAAGASDDDTKATDGDATAAEGDDDEDDDEEAGDLLPSGGKSDGRRSPPRFTPRIVIQKTKPTLLLQGSLTRVHLPDLDDLSERNKDDSESNDCLSDRKAVLDEQKNGDTVLYVPECTLDGRYQKVQCYRSTGYCWCVHEDTGKPIPGTSVKDQHPKCDALLIPDRPMKGCPEQRKSAFIRDLMTYLENQMKSGGNGSGSPGSPDMSKWHASKEEQIATWSFVMLDKNKNKVLERKEWKTFRALVMPVQNLRRCGKKLPRYCDINHDRKISITEWLNCLNAKREINTENSTPAVVSVMASRRKGPNPLESYLKGD